jgi:hypothetical protein
MIPAADTPLNQVATVRADQAEAADHRQTHAD